MQREHEAQQRPLLQIVPEEHLSAYLSAQCSVTQLSTDLSKYTVTLALNLTQAREAVRQIYLDVEAAKERSRIFPLSMDTEGEPVSLVSLGYIDTNDKFKIYLFHLAFFNWPILLGDHLAQILSDRFLHKFGADLTTDVSRLNVYLQRDEVITNWEDLQLTALEQGLDLNNGHVASLDTLAKHFAVGQKSKSSIVNWNRPLSEKAIAYCCDDIFLGWHVWHGLRGRLSKKTMPHVMTKKEDEKLVVSDTAEVRKVAPRGETKDALSEAELRRLVPEFVRWITNTWKKTNVPMPTPYSSVVNLAINGFSELAKAIPVVAARRVTAEKLVVLTIDQKHLVQTANGRIQPASQPVVRSE